MNHISQALQSYAVARSLASLEMISGALVKSVEVNAVLKLQNKKLLTALEAILAAHVSDGDGSVDGVAVLSKELAQAARDAVALAKGD